MKIGIITMYYDNANYGGLLQAYALQKVVTSIGFECEQISYDFYRDSYGDNIIKHHLRKIKRFLSSLYNPFYRKNSLYKKELKKFEKSIPHSNVRYSKNISKIESEYDAFICGSDQIWNPVWWHAEFFASFSKKKKFSYAASIARDTITENELATVQEYTRDFYALSVREKNNAEFLTNKLHKKFQLMPDPTLLFTKEEWNIIFPYNGCMKKPYIFAYFLGFNDMQRNECIKFAKDNGFDIYFIPYMRKESYSWDKVNEKYCSDDYRVENFINLIRNAELILTDSFHGAVFSCIFEKPFYVLNRELIGKEKSMNSRLETLFYELSIPQDRMIDRVTDANEYEFSIDEIEAIRMAKEKWRKIGLNYITTNLEKIKNEQTK